MRSIAFNLSENTADLFFFFSPQRTRNCEIKKGWPLLRTRTYWMSFKSTFSEGEKKKRLFKYCIYNISNDISSFLSQRMIAIL